MGLNMVNLDMTLRMDSPEFDCNLGLEIEWTIIEIEPIISRLSHIFSKTGK